jgi:cobalt-zinc-cadmium efflux system membrane fusion protein
MMSARIASFAIVLVALGCGSKPTAEQSGHGAPSPSVPTNAGRLVSVSPDLISSGRIVVVPAALSAPRDDLTVTGEITAPPDGAAEVGAPIGGIVRGILAKEGDRVAKDQRLAVLEAAEVARTVADLGRAEARRTRAQRVLEQEEELMAGKATSERNLADARSELAAAEAEARGARTLLSTFGAANGGRIVVKSPIAGTVVTRTVVLGKPVDAGARLFRIVNGEKLLVRADVPENDAADIHEGSEATLVWAARKESCKGTVDSRAPSVDPTTRTVPFRVRPNPDCPQLVEGGFVDVTLPRPTTTAPSLIALPRDAVVEMDAVPVVFVATSRPGEFRAATVRIARLTSSTAYVEDGVQPGQSVVVKGAILLKGELMRAALE